MFDFKKSYIIILLLGVFCAFDVAAKDKDGLSKKEKSVKEPDKKECNKADSLNAMKVPAITKDSLSKEHRHNSQSSMSSMSYNILFQVIYRYSFKEIFDSPAASEIVTN